MADYTTLSDVKGQLVETSLTSDYDTQLSAFIVTASRLIDGYLGVHDGYFAPSTDAVVRYYDGNNSDVIKIDNFTSVTALGVAESGGVQSSDYVSWSSSDYFVYPYNAAARGKPYTSIVVDIENGEKTHFPAYRKAVKVTAIFGDYYTVHPLVAQACNTQVVQWFMRAKNAWQNTGANEGMLTDTGGKLSEDVKAMLQPLLLEML